MTELIKFYVDSMDSLSLINMRKVFSFFM